jgi:hypothetical protein
MVPFVLTSKSVTLFPFGEPPLTVDASHMNFDAVVEALKARDFDRAVQLGSVKSFVNTMTAGNVAVTDDGVTYKGQPITGYLANKMMLFFREGLPIDHYCKFLDNLMANPSMTSRNELFLFLEAADLPITPDGYFLAYKAVRADFRDKHSGRFDNSPSKVHSMPRHDVDDDRNKTCSYGFHAAAYEYARGFMSHGDKMVAVKIDPANVVSVPSDYGNQKLRCTSYEVMFEVPDADDIFKGKPIDDMDAAHAAQEEEDFLFWLGQDGSED